MVVHCGHRTEGHGLLRRRLSQATGLALGIAMLGTIGLSGTLAQDDGGAAAPDAEVLVNSIIEQVFGEVFGGSVASDETADSGAGDINVGGSTGSTVTMGGGSGGSVNMGGGVTVDDSYGG
jgi:hypothetical protein